MGICNSSTTDMQSEHKDRVHGNQEENRRGQMATSGSPNSSQRDEGMAWLYHKINDIKRTPDEVERALKEHEEVRSKLRQREEQLKQKEKENRSLKERLAKVSDTKCMQDPSGKTENIQRRNRQSILENGYRNFLAHEGLDAVVVIETCRKTPHDQSNKTQAEIEDKQLARMILELAYQEAEKVCNDFLSSCPYILNYASSVGIRLTAERDSTRHTSGSAASNEEAEMACEDSFCFSPHTLNSAASAATRLTAERDPTRHTSGSAASSETKMFRFEVGCNLPDSCKISLPFKEMMLSELGEMSQESNIKELCKIIKNSVTTELRKERKFSLQYNIDGLLINKKMKKYIKQCARLCWRLVTHNPPLKIVRSHLGERQPFDPNSHQIWQGQNIAVSKFLDGSSLNAEIVWPALVDHKGKILWKAEVIIEEITLL